MVAFGLLCNLGAVREKWACLAASYAAEKLGTHSHALILPCGKNQGPRRDLPHWLVLPCGRADISKVKFFSYPMCPISIFFSPTVCWSFSAGFLDFHKGSVVSGWLSKSVMSRDCPRPWPRDAWSVHRPYEGPQPGPRYMCLLPGAQVG